MHHTHTRAHTHTVSTKKERERKESLLCHSSLFLTHTLSLSLLLSIAERVSHFETALHRCAAPLISLCGDSPLWPKIKRIFLFLTHPPSLFPPLFFPMFVNFQLSSHACVRMCVYVCVCVCVCSQSPLSLSLFLSLCFHRPLSLSHSPRLSPSPSSPPLNPLRAPSVLTPRRS